MNFESRTSKNGKHYFLLLNDNSEVVIQSEMYKSSERVSGGMSLVEDWYPRGLALRTNKNDRFYYVLEDGDGNILGRCPGSRSFADSIEALTFASSATRREVEPTMELVDREYGPAGEDGPNGTEIETSKVRRWWDRAMSTLFRRT